jgi:stearoyl-CoA desaturase (Delta-9 desaturase)
MGSLCGRRRYVTGDDSRNNWLLAIFTMGEGWHNSHHAYQSSVRQGFRWWEIDLTFYMLRVLSWLGLVWDLKTPPVEVRRNEHRLGSRVIERAAAQLAGSFDPDLIVSAIASALAGPSLSAIQESLANAQNRAADVLASFYLPQLPTRREIVSRAMAMFAETPRWTPSSVAPIWPSWTRSARGSVPLRRKPIQPLQPPSQAVSC